MKNAVLREIESKFNVKTNTFKYKDIEAQLYTWGEGPNLFFSLPSFPYSGSYYIWLFDHIDTKKYKFVTLDFPGWAGLTPPIKNFTIDEIVGLSKSIIDKTDYEKLSIIGYSFGGAVATKLALNFNEEIERLILVSTVIKGDLLKEMPIMNLFNFAKLMRLYPAIKLFIKNRFNVLSKQMDTNDPDVLELLKLYKTFLENIDPRIIVQSIGELTKLDVTNELKTLNDKVKKLYIVNSREEDHLFRRQAEILRRHLEGENSFFLHGTHDDFILKPNKKVLDEILK